MNNKVFLFSIFWTFLLFHVGLTIAAMPTTTPYAYNRVWDVPATSHQGNIPSCSGHAFWGILEAQQRNGANFAYIPSGDVIYYLSGDDLTMHGRYGEMVANTLVKYGYLKSWRWLFDPHEVAKHIVNVSPVTLEGAWWEGIGIPKHTPPYKSRYEGTATGDRGIGHSVYCYGYENGFFLCRNSHGDTYGDKGTVHLSYATMGVLLRTGSRVIAPTIR